MEEFTRYGKQGMKIIREILLEYKFCNNLTNQEMAHKCDISTSAYGKIMNSKIHSDFGACFDTIAKLRLNLGIDINSVIDSLKQDGSE